MSLESQCFSQRRIDIINWKKYCFSTNQDFQSCMFTFFLSEKIQMIRWLEEILLPVHFHKFCAASTGVALLDCMFKHTHTHTFIVRSRARSSRCYGLVFVVKGPLKYLVAKLHGCYPGANSLPVSQNFFARFFRHRPVADSSRCLFFTSLQQTQKTLFAYNFFH